MPCLPSASQHAFSSVLHVEPRECRVLLTDPALNPKANRARMLEVMFETFGFQGAFMQIQAILTLYAQGELELQLQLELGGGPEPSCGA